MDRNIKEIIKKYGLDKSVLVLAVSGGVDSVVLLDLMAQNLDHQNLIVAHVNHGLRRESREEAEFVASLAQKYGTRFESTALGLKKSDENTARTKRYDFLRKVAQNNKAKYIVTAHHQDDQAETILLSLIRGSGPLEVWGMKELENELLRPLLSFPKNELVKYAKGHKLKYHTDKSNADVRYARNRIRHNISPEIRKLNSSFEETLARNAALGLELGDYIDAQTVKAEKRLVHGNKMELAGLLRLDPFIQKEIIRRQLIKHQGRRQDIYQKNVSEVLSLLTKSGQKETRLGKLAITKTYKYLVFSTADRNNQAYETDDLKSKWQNFGKMSLRARIGTTKSTRDNILLPIEFSGKLKVRNWRPGDKITAIFGTKKIQDVFTDAKVDKSDRASWPVVVLDNEIVWVPKLIASTYAKKRNKNLILEVK